MAQSWIRESSKNKGKPKSERRWEVVYNDPLTGRRRTKGGFPRKRDAEEWQTAHEHSRRAGSYMDPASSGGATFQQAAREWLGTRADLKPRTAGSYRTILEGPNSRLMRKFGGAPVGNVRREDVQGFIDELRASKLSPSTIRNNYYVMTQVMSELVKRRCLPYNPCADVHLPRAATPQQTEDERYNLSPGDVHRICAALPAPYSLVVLIAAYVGLRAGEIAGLQLRDLDLDGLTLRVRRVVVDLDGVLAYDAPKTEKSRRAVTLDPHLARELADHVVAHKAAAAAWFGGHPGNRHPGDALPLFVGTATGRAYGEVRLDYSRLFCHKGWYKRYWRGALRQAGLPDSVRFHDLRHACAFWLLDDGVGYKDISDQLGHANIGITINRYAHRDQNDAHDRIRRAMAGRHASFLSEVRGSVVPLRRRDAR